MGVKARSRNGSRFVLVHGAWHGGWCWDRVAGRLRAEGHVVLAPTLPGLGERAHLLSSALTVDACVEDLQRQIEAWSGEPVVLVGHSFGGSVALGVADRSPKRIERLVLLDALVLENGESAFSTLEPEIVAARRRAVAERGGGLAMPVPPVSAFGVPEEHPDAVLMRHRLTPHLVATYESPLTLRHPVGNGRPCVYIHCTRPDYAPLEASRLRARTRTDWAWLEIATGHDAMITAPDLLSDMLARLTGPFTEGASRESMACEEDRG